MRRYSPGQILVLLLIGLALLYYLFPGAFRNPSQIGRELPSQLVELAIRVVAIVLCIAVHEANHAFVAVSLGDPTPKLMGRLTLNPIKHLDPIGTLLLFIAQFGWGKPVLFNPHNLRIDPRLGSAAVSFAGPLANVLFAMAIVWTLRLTHPALDPVMGEFVDKLLIFNVVLAAFNLVPIPPLDGYGVVQGLLPARLAIALEPIRQYGPIILLAAIFLPSILGPRFDIIRPIMNPILNVILTLLKGE